jgi:ribonucleoside-diphosphate reductase alpha chain
MMYIDHPDILKFLHAKEDLSQFTNYNISVKITDSWMESYLEDADGPHVVRNPRNGSRFLIPKDVDIWEYDVRSLVPVGRDGAAAEGEFYTKRDIWSFIINNAHRTGEPGVCFIDRVNEHNPTPHVGRMEATNPCGEQPLLPYEACNLGSINLAAFIVEDVSGKMEVDWNELRVAVHDSTRFLDNVIDANRYPLPEIDKICKSNRKIGLGIMGFADALFRLGIPYNSEEGVAMGERFMQFVNDEAHNYSESLARDRGCFPNWKGSIYDTKFDRPMRNATCTTVAPTGTISIIAGCSGGIEPMYSLAFFRNVLRGQKEGNKPMIEVNQIFETIAREEGIYSEGLMDQLATDGTLAQLDVPEAIKKIFVCAHDISPEWHMRMQAAFQKHCDSSISKTINFPETATVDEVEEIYRLAFELECKGVTVYRNGCREHQPMALKSSDKTGSKKAPAASEVADAVAVGDSYVAGPVDLKPATLPEICTGIRVRQLTPFGNMHINITVDPATERELEVFAQLGKGGDLANSDLEAICRLISLWLRAGGSLDHVIRQLQSIGSSLQVHTKEGKIMSLGDGLARALRKYAHAKKSKGLRGLILGHDDKSDSAADVPAGNGAAGSNGKGNGSGHVNGGGNGHGQGHAPVSAAAHAAPVSGEKEASTMTHGMVATSAMGQGVMAQSHNRMDPLGLQWQQTQYKVICPECQNHLRFSEGCVTCDGCGFSKC